MNVELSTAGLDEFGTVENTLDGARLVRKAIQNNGAVVFPWSYGNGGAYIFCIVMQKETIGIMPFGGSSRDRIYVGLYGKGCSHFSADNTHANYWNEKINLDMGAGEEFSKFWDMIWSLR